MCADENIWKLEHYSACEGTYTSGEAHTFCWVLTALPSDSNIGTCSTYRPTDVPLENLVQWQTRRGSACRAPASPSTNATRPMQQLKKKKHRGQSSWLGPDWLRLDGRGHLLFHDLLILPWHRMGQTVSISQGNLAVKKMASETWSKINKDHQFIRHPFWSSLIIHSWYSWYLMVMLCHLCPRSDNPSHSFLEFAFRPCHGRLPRLKYISTWMSLVPLRDGFFKIAGHILGSYFPLASHSITHPGLFSSIWLCPTWIQVLSRACVILFLWNLMERTDEEILSGAPSEAQKFSVRLAPASAL